MIKLERICLNFLWILSLHFFKAKSKVKVKGEIECLIEQNYLTSQQQEARTSVC